MIGPYPGPAPGAGRNGGRYPTAVGTFAGVTGRPDPGAPVAAGAGARFGWRLAHLPVVLAATGGLGVVALAAGWLAGGAASAAGAAAGVALVAGSYLLTTLLVAWADSVDVRLVLPVGLTTYLVKFTVIGIVMAAVVATGWDGLPALGVGVVAAVVVWTGSHIWWTVTHQPRLEYRAPRRAQAPTVD